MPRRSSQHTKPQSNAVSAPLELSTIFIGREHEFAELEYRLEQWRHLTDHFTQGAPFPQIEPSPRYPLPGLLILLQGHAGLGKSTLLWRFYEQVQLLNQRFNTSKILLSDKIYWEDEIGSSRGMFDLPTGQEIDARAYFSLLCRALASKIGKKTTDFKHYQQAIKTVDQAHDQTFHQIEKIKQEDNSTALKDLAGESVIQLLRLIPPPLGPILDVLQSDPAKKIAGISANFGINQLKSLYERLHARLGETLEDTLDPALKLGAALGKDLQYWAKNQLILIFFDTYEEIDEGDRLLRVVMAAAGERVGWVLAGRDNLWDGNRHRDLRMVHGYKDIVRADRSLVINFQPGSTGPFTPHNIEEFFAQLRQKTQQYKRLPIITPDQAGEVFNMTRGIPLAVKIAAEIYLQTGGKISPLTEEIERMESGRLVGTMIEHYLRLPLGHREDHRKLYGLALLRRVNPSAALDAALGITSEQAESGLDTQELARLHRRYSFIFTEKAQPALHQEVRYFLRLWLLAHRTEPEIAALNTRIRDAHEQALKQLEEKRRYQNLKERLEDEEWVATYLDLIEQHFWGDPAEGIRYALPVMITASVYQPHVLHEVTRLGSFFEAQLKPPYQEWWYHATESLVYPGYLLLKSSTSEKQKAEVIGMLISPEENSTSLNFLAQLVAQQKMAFPAPLPESKEQLEAALWWQLGALYRGIDNRQAWEWFDRALTVLSEEATLREAAAETLVSIANNLAQTKKYDEILPLLKRAIKLDPHNAAAHYSHGLASEHLQDYHQAITDFSQVITLAPALAALAYYSRGIAYTGLEEYRQAIADYNQALTLDPQNASAYCNRGANFAKLGQYQQALEDFSQTLALDTKHIHAYYNRAQTYHKLRDYQRALDDYSQALSLDPSLAMAFHNRGVINVDTGNLQRAIEDYTQAIALEPALAAAYLSRGNVFAYQGEYQHAIDDFSRSIGINPKDAMAWYNRGNTYSWLQNYAQAIEDYSQAIALDLTYTEAYSQRGVAYAKLGSPEQALIDFSKAIALDASFVPAYVNQGMAYRDLKKFDQAISEFTQALALDPANAVAYYNRGAVYHLLHNYQQAIANYTQAIKSDPGLALAYSDRGAAYEACEDYKQAIDDYTQVLALTPEDMITYYHRASAHSALQDYLQAIEDFNQVITLAPRHTNAYFDRGLMHVHVKNYHQALEDFTQVIKLAPTDAEAYTCRADIYLQLGALQEAHADYRRCVELNSSDITVAWMAEWTGMNQKRVGIAVAKRLEMMAGPDPQEYIAIVCSAVASGIRGQFEQGLKKLAQALALQPEQFHAYFWKGMLLAYQTPEHPEYAKEGIENALTLGMPQILLMPLYWLQSDYPDCYKQMKVYLMDKDNKFV